MKTNQLSRTLIYALRHKPEEFQLSLNSQGWCDINQVLANFQKIAPDISVELIQNIVRTNNKQRFELAEDDTKIRARQGHSTQVSLEYPSSTPPAILFHGTTQENLSSILQKGLVKGSRHAVHLTESYELAVTTAKRWKKPIHILQITTTEMSENGIQFCKSPNNVWLVDHVPAKYLQETNPKKTLSSKR